MHEHHDHGPCSNHGHCHDCSGHQEAMAFNDKLNLLLNHWIEHNEAHQTDYKKWALQAREEGGLDEVVAKIQEAMQLFQEGNQRLRQAQQILMMD